MRIVHKGLSAERHEPSGLVVMYARRFYRDDYKAENLVFFRAAVGQTDLYIGAWTDLHKEAIGAVKECRGILEEYIRRHPEFLHSLEPVDPLAGAPAIVMEMCEAARIAGVGPMAAVAGAVARFVGRKLVELSGEVIVENGGDIFLHSRSDRRIGIFAGNSPLSGRLGILVRKEMSPGGICTSSGTVGHSLSFGKADAALVVSKDTSLADACATALGNRVKTPEDVEEALNFITCKPGVIGALVIIGEFVGALGDIELVKL